MTTTAAVAPRQKGQAGYCFVFDEADWSFYELILEKVAGQRVFVTFDGERLEVMSPSFKHDVSGERIGDLIKLILTEQDRPYIAGGSFTLKKRRANRGLEPDKCFFIQHVAEVSGKEEVDLRIDPPPDLAIEVEISRRLLDRVDIYRRLRVPEVWCYDVRRLRVLQLHERRYRDVPRSPTFPTFPLEELHRILQQSWQSNDLAWGKEARAWIRRHLANPPSAS